jgi:CRISPR system Cascade subunit CasE
VINEGQAVGRKPPGPHRMTFQSVRFEGLLTVIDPERFCQTLAAGIGSAKAFGFGLLSVARP